MLNRIAEVVQTSLVGAATGPGTPAVSISLTERVNFQVGAHGANLLSHANYVPPNTTFNTASFGNARRTFQQDIMRR
jgi:hypothetical protein